jgi:steroid delta-isomerase-like uncharacterized protein
VTPEENKALVRRWFEEMDRGNLAAIDELLAEDYVDHNPPLPDLPAGRAGVRRASELLLDAFPDAVHIIEEQQATGDRVMTRVLVRGSFTREFLGFPPTGTVVELHGMAVHRIADGRLAEHWAQVDMLAFAQQLEPDTAPR